MLALKLVNTIEEHAERLTQAVVQALRTDPRTPSYHTLAVSEDHSRVFTVVRHLGTWLDIKSDAATESAYRGLGQKRFLEGVPLAEVVCALMLTEQTIHGFIQAEGWIDSALDLRQQAELGSLISRFFQRAIYFTVLSYEAEARAAARLTAAGEPRKRRLEGGWAFRKSANSG